MKLIKTKSDPLLGNSEFNKYKFKVKMSIERVGNLPGKYYSSVILLSLSLSLAVYQSM